MVYGREVTIIASIECHLHAIKFAMILFFIGVARGYQSCPRGVISPSLSHDARLIVKYLGDIITQIFWWFAKLNAIVVQKSHRWPGAVIFKICWFLLSENSHPTFLSTQKKINSIWVTKIGSEMRWARGKRTLNSHCEIVNEKRQKMKNWPWIWIED